MRRCAILFCVIFWIFPFLFLLGSEVEKGLLNSDEISFVESLEETLAVPAKEHISFPFLLESTDLVVKGICAYDGPFWEDGSGQEVTGVTALLLENTGSYGMDRVWVVMQQGNRLLRFTANTIPPGATVAVLESDKAVFQKQDIDICYGWHRLQLDGWKHEEILLREIDMGTISLQNTTDETIRNIRLLYKDSLQGMYIGGVTNMHTVKELLPGEIIAVDPERYARGNSKIICVLTD